MSDTSCRLQLEEPHFCSWKRVLSTKLTTAQKAYAGTSAMPKKAGICEWSGYFAHQHDKCLLSIGFLTCQKVVWVFYPMITRRMRHPGLIASGKIFWGSSFALWAQCPFSLRCYWTVHCCLCSCRGLLSMFSLYLGHWSAKQLPDCPFMTR